VPEHQPSVGEAKRLLDLVLPQLVVLDGVVR
jgi:hypothetical protein